MGIRAGIVDARAGHAPFGRRLLAGAERRGQLLKESIKRALSPLVLAFVLDVILQKMNRIWRRVRPRRTADAT